MNNRRIGGGMNNQRAGMNNNNRSSSSSFSQQPFHQQNGGQCPNPWQGGGGTNSSSSSSNQNGILSQLTANPQLALALSSLLQPHHHQQQQQQHHQQQQQPPSLLSLNPSPAFSNSNNNHREYGRFPLNRGRDFRRHEPYNKGQNRGGFLDRRRRSPPRRQERRDDRSKDDAKKRSVEKKPAEEKAAAVVPKEETNETSVVKEDVTDEDKKETKRDWKEEKNNAEIKNDNVDETEAVAKKNDDDEGDGKDGKYGGIPRRYLHCFVCNKQMWDGESMGKHVRGRAHYEMLKALEESIHICVNILRENLRLQEERKTIEFNRQTRQRKFNNRREPPLSNCAMCDLKFMGKIISHRRTEGHQRLKRYLHPTCRICEKEYPSRIEWIEHCLTPEHLKRASDNTENRIGGKDGDVVIVSAELEDVDMELTLEENLKMEGEDPILEIDSSLANMVDRLPAYKNERPVAVGCLKEFSGWKCDLCNRSFPNKEDADGHLKTKRHFYRFIEFIKERFDREEKKKKSNSVDEGEPKQDVNDDEEENTKEELLEPNEDDEFLEHAVNKIADVDEEIDQEMYDRTEKLPEEEDLLPAEEVFDNVDVKIELPDIKEEECDSEEILDSVTLETNNSGIPRLTRKTPLSGPKSKRGRKVQ